MWLVTTLCCVSTKKSQANKKGIISGIVVGRCSPWSLAHKSGIEKISNLPSYVFFLPFGLKMLNTVSFSSKEIRNLNMIFALLASDQRCESGFLHNCGPLTTLCCVSTKGSRQKIGIIPSMLVGLCSPPLTEVKLENRANDRALTRT